MKAEIDAPGVASSETGKAGVSDAETLAAEPGQSVLEPADRVKDPGTQSSSAWDLLGLQHRLYLGEKRAGWDPDDSNTFAEEVAHLHEEVSEAFRAFRLTKDYALTLDASGKPQGVPAEFADVLIGMYYIAERFGFDLDAAVETKHRYNLTRSYEAEGRRLHDPCYSSARTEADRG